jgi:hypothetical protein
VTCAPEQCQLLFPNGRAYLTAARAGCVAYANDQKDETNRDNMRIHLGHISRAFQSGDFDIPMFVHDTVPPGVPELKRLQKQIRYTFGETAAGGRIVISTANVEALAAIHRFLQVQTEEHKTGDSTAVH